METRYLYNTVKMIWNNVISPSEPFGDVISWKFSEENYPDNYLIAIFCAGFMELVKRNDPISTEFLTYIRIIMKRETAKLERLV